MMSFVMLVTTIAPLVCADGRGRRCWCGSAGAIFWILALAALLASAMIAFISETLPVEQRQNLVCAPLGNFATCSGISGC